MGSDAARSQFVAVFARPFVEAASTARKPGLRCPGLGGGLAPAAGWIKEWMMRNRKRRTSGIRGVLRLPVLAAPAVLAASLVVLPATRLAPGPAALTVQVPLGVNSASQMAVPGSAAFPTGTLFDGSPAVGALFTTTADGGLLSHFCSASVVDSPAEDLVITAAHCVAGTTASDIAFVPGYHNGQTPHGIWFVKRIIVDVAWTSSADPNDDFAFLVIDRSGAGATVQGVTGGESLAIDEPPSQLTRVIGYPDGENSPITCENRAFAFSATQLEFDCGGYTDGTSGGPWLVNISPSTGLGSLVGVIGGYQQGGDTPAISYAARFNASVAALYQVAIGAS